MTTYEEAHIRLYDAMEHFAYLAINASMENQKERLKRLAKLSLILATDISDKKGGLEEGNIVRTSLNHDDLTDRLDAGWEVISNYLRNISIITNLSYYVGSAVIGNKTRR